MSTFYAHCPHCARETVHVNIGVGSEPSKCTVCHANNQPTKGDAYMKDRTTPTTVMHCHRCSRETEHRRNDELRPFFWYCVACAIPWRPFTIRDVARLAARHRPSLAKRVHRAVGILRRNPPRRQTPGDDRFWLVSSMSRPEVVYLVDRDDHTCTCPDFRSYRQALRHGAPHGWCKHRLAVSILHILEKAGPIATRESLAILGSPLG